MRPEGLVAAGSGMLALSVLADSAIEHDRGSFSNPAMWLPLGTSALAACTGGAAMVGHGARPWLRRATQGGSAGVGLLGLGFHAFNIAKRPGGLSWLNLMRAAPIGAPAALILSGLLSVSAETMARDRALARPVAGLTVLGLAGTVGEVGLLHFRGAFQHRPMWLPLMIPPIAALSLGRDALDGHPRRASAGLLSMTALLGVAGSAFHARGIARRMGGWRNWRQNLLAGPPLPAPPSFTGLAIAGIGALLVMGLSIGRARGATRD